MAKNNNRNQSGRHNNNPEGHNQYTNDWMVAAKERPFTSAAAAAGAVAAGAFLWSRRNQISGQISRLSGQITDWAEDMRSNSGREVALTDGPNESSAIESSRATAARSGRSSGTKSRSTSKRSSTDRTTRGMSETGGGNASIGAHTGSGPGGTTGAGPRA